MIHVDRRELTAILQRACKVANGQVTPGGGAVHVSVDAQHLRVCSTNYEQSITEVLPALCANGDAAGTVCPDARAVLSCIKGLPSSTTEVILGVDRGRVRVFGGAVCALARGLPRDPAPKPTTRSTGGASCAFGWDPLGSSRVV